MGKRVSFSTIHVTTYYYKCFILDSQNKIPFLYQNYIICCRSTIWAAWVAFPCFCPCLMLHFTLSSMGLSDVWSSLSESVAQGSCTPFCVFFKRVDRLAKVESQILPSFGFILNNLQYTTVTSFSHTNMCLLLLKA